MLPPQPGGAAHSCKMMVPIYQTTQGHIPESNNLQLTLLPHFLMCLSSKYYLKCGLWYNTRVTFAKILVPTMNISINIMFKAAFINW